MAASRSDTITIEFVGDIAKLARSSSRASSTLVKDMRGAEGDVGKSANRMADKFEDAFDGIHARIGTKVGPGFASLGGKLGGKIVGGFAAIGIGAVIADQFNEALNIDAGVDKLEARLGLTAKEAGRIGELAGDTYAGAWGESMEEVQGFYAATMRAFPDLTEKALQKVTESAATTADVWDQDFNEVVRVAQQLLVNGLAPDAQTAMDMVATALQKTKGPQEEVLAALDEYSNHFGQLGLNGSNILGALTSKWATNQYAIDKVGDAVKELGIRTLDGSDTTKEGLDKIGLSVGEVESAFAKGGETAGEMTKRIITGIIGIEDPAERARVGVALMGTPFEDLGKNAVPILKDVVEGQEELTDTVKVGNDAYDNAKTRIESFRREGLLRLTKFIGNTAIPSIEGLIDEFDSAVGIISGDQGSGGVPAISNAVSQHLGVEVPDVLSQSGKEWEGYADKVEEAKKDSIKSFGDLLDTLEDDTLTFGEKFGLIWSDLWNETEEEKRRNERGILGDSENTFAKLLRGVIEWDRKWAREWSESWSDSKSLTTRITDAIGRTVDAWTGGLLTRARTWARQHGQNWREAWEATVTRVRTEADKIVTRIQTFLNTARDRVRVWGFVLPLLFRRIISDAGDHVKDRLDRIVGFFRDLPGRIGRAVSGLAKTVKDKVQKVLSGITANLKINLGFGGDGLGIGGLGQLGGGLMGVSPSSAVGRAYTMLGRPGDVVSGFRPGARTAATGALSYHARGRALDITPSMAIFELIRRTFGSRSKELIFSPAGSRQIWNGRPHMYSGITRAQHFDHIHWAMAQGGVGTVTKPTLFLAGERGREDFAFAPATKGGMAALTGGATPHVDVQVFIGNEQLDAHTVRVAAKVYDARARAHNVRAGKGGR